MYMTFASRQDAGRKLGHHLLDEGVQVEIVAGLPRGGVVVAAEVAHVLHAPLTVLVVRKIGHPLHREFAVGALAESNVVVLDDNVIGSNANVRSALNYIIREESERLSTYQEKFHFYDKPALEGKGVLIVDDGLATGATTEAAVLSAFRQDARSVVVAVPVASINALERLQRIANQVIALIIDPDFDAVGRYYEEFSQTTDDEVMELLKAQHTH